MKRATNGVASGGDGDDRAAHGILMLVRMPWVTAIGLPGGKMLPKAGVFAHAQAEVVADNLAAAAAGAAAGTRFDGHGSCFLETGGGRAGYASGNFYAVPDPAVRMRAPSRRWHWGKVLFERRWLARLR